jgi:class 3 adenylate cyclase
MERRLAAVLVADMVGFSRLMENNESDIIDRPNSH